MADKYSTTYAHLRETSPDLLKKLAMILELWDRRFDAPETIVELILDALCEELREEPK